MSSGCASHVTSCARVSATKRRDTLLFATARSVCTRGQRIERAAVRARRDADREGFQRVGVQRIAAGGVRKARQLELGAVDTARAEAGHEDAPAAERDFPRDLPVAIRAAVGIGHVRWDRRAACDPPPSSSAAPAWPASKQRPKNAVRVSASTSSSGSGSWTVARDEDASASPATGLVRVFFIGGFLPWLW